ncbi:hypothetical protein AB0395_33225 [Streptosporangium sp. NPDC051023]|uniref:hypothetical protein n=1 Tax=Streptosporangium sp. NPDC051023 TaxID=3155410 RepID=UPI00344B7170
MTAENPPNENMIAALLRERDVYVAAGHADRVAQVDEQLAYYGHTKTVEVPKERTAASRQTTDASSADARPSRAARRRA